MPTATCKLPAAKTAHFPTAGVTILTCRPARLVHSCRHHPCKRFHRFTILHHRIAFGIARPFLQNAFILLQWRTHTFSTTSLQPRRSGTRWLTAAVMRPWSNGCTWMPPWHRKAAWWCCGRPLTADLGRTRRTSAVPKLRLAHRPPPARPRLPLWSHTSTMLGRVGGRRTSSGHGAEYCYWLCRVR